MRSASRRLCRADLVLACLATPETQAEAPSTDDACPSLHPSLLVLVKPPPLLSSLAARPSRPGVRLRLRPGDPFRRTRPRGASIGTRASVSCGAEVPVWPWHHETHGRLLREAAPSKGKSSAAQALASCTGTACGSCREKSEFGLSWEPGAQNSRVLRAPKWNLPAATRLVHGLQLKDLARQPEVLGILRWHCDSKNPQLLGLCNGRAANPHIVTSSRLGLESTSASKAKPSRPGNGLRLAAARRHDLDGQCGPNPAKTRQVVAT